MATMIMLAVNGCSMLQPEPLDPPVINLLAFEPLAMGINSQAFRVRLSLYNPNTVPLNVSGGEMQLELAGTRAAKGRTLEPFSVGAGATTEVDVRVSTNLLRDLPALFRALSSGNTSAGVDYRLSGHVDVERRGLDRLPIDSSGKLEIPASILGQPLPMGPAAPSSAPL